MRSTTTLMSWGWRSSASLHRASGTRRVIIPCNQAGSAVASASTACSQWRRPAFLRDLTRLRKKWVGHMTSEKNRIQKVLEASNIKLSSVISDVFGVSGRKLLEHLINEGYIDPEDVEQKIHGRMSHKKQKISDSLGTLNEHQLFLIKQSWMHITYLEELISDIDKRIDTLLEKYESEFKILTTMTGIKKETASILIAEMGVDMSQFHSSKHLASWAGLSPGNHESAGKRKSTRSVKGNPHIKSALCEAAWAASRSRNTRFSVKYWSIVAGVRKKHSLPLHIECLQ